MLHYSKLDSYKICDQLALKTYDITDEIQTLDKDDVLLRLRYCALRAVGRIAFASACTFSLKFRHGVLMCALGWLMEYQEMLSLARKQGTLPAKVCDDLDALRGRGAFYLHKQMEDDVKKLMDG